MLKIFDDLLTEKEIEQLKENHDDLKFGTIVYNEDSKIPIIMSQDEGISIGKIKMQIEKFVFND